MSRKILAPHKEQDGWAYVRVCLLKTPRPQRYAIGNIVPGRGLGDYIAYYHDHDQHTKSRIISSRRVEEAVETADYLKRCAEEGIHATFHGHTRTWTAWRDCDAWDVHGDGPTLREAYYRYHAAAGEQR